MHEFDLGGKTLAFILGSWSEQEYRLWGVYDVNLENGVGYHKTVHLEKVIPGAGAAVDVAKEHTPANEAPAATLGTSRDSYGPLRSRDADDNERSRSPTHQGSDAPGIATSPRSDSRGPRHDTTRGSSTSDVHRTSANGGISSLNEIRKSACRSTPSRVTPSAATHHHSTSSLSAAYEDVEAHVVDLQDGSGDLVIDYNKQLANHLRRLKTAADTDDENTFGMMWRAVNRDLIKAGLERLPVP